MDGDLTARVFWIAAWTASALACATPGAAHPAPAAAVASSAPLPPPSPVFAGTPLTDAEEVEVRQRLADALVAERSWEAALPHLRWLRQQHGGRWPVLLDFAQAVYLVRADGAAALAALEEALLLKPINPRAMLLMGQILEDQGEGARARLAYAQVLRWRPDEAQAALNLARLLRFDEPAEARRLYESIVQRDPRHLVALFELASLAEREGRLEDAEQRYRQLQALHPDVLTGQLQLVRFFQRTQQPERARAAERELERSRGRRPGARAR